MLLGTLCEEINEVTNKRKMYTDDNNKNTAFF